MASGKNLTPKERVEIALASGRADVVPFTVYEYKLPQCGLERELRNRGLCVLERRAPVYKTHRPNCRTTQQVYWENGKQFTRTHLDTPAGHLSTLSQTADFTAWHHEKMFKTPDDYKAMLALIEDERYEPDYAAFLEAERRWGGDASLRAGFGLEPLQTLISSNFMKMEDFCIQWMDHRDEILKLYAAIVEKRRQLYPIVAASPAGHANYGGNVVPEIVSPDMFREYYTPHYNEAAEIMHKQGKLVGSHFDDDCRHLAQVIGETDLDYIEAFTPAPDTDMTLAEARDAWPDKVLWINFPSSVHLKSDAEVERFTVEMLSELDTIDGLIVGVTEDMPPDRHLDSCKAIMDGLDRHAKENPELYA
ncbi:MAG TPA: uroporphyrinogen decarboxylase family protein [Planctomycetota bacterium]|nr:uroporphyrinogen decarboxylase family protein [Planctomycetota bacterium]